MIYSSILPKDFVPSFDCVRWLENEYQRLADKVSAAIGVYDFDNACSWASWANLIQNAREEAWRAINRSYDRQFQHGEVVF